MCLKNVNGLSELQFNIILLRRDDKITVPQLFLYVSFIFGDRDGHLSQTFDIIMSWH